MAIPSTPKPSGISTGEVTGQRAPEIGSTGISHVANINTHPVPAPVFSTNGGSVSVPADNFTDGPV